MSYKIKCEYCKYTTQVHGYINDREPFHDIICEHPESEWHKISIDIMTDCALGSKLFVGMKEYAETCAKFEFREFTLTEDALHFLGHFITIDKHGQISAPILEQKEFQKLLTLVMFYDSGRT